MPIAITIFVGLLVGILVGASGTGAAAITTPVLVLLLGRQPSVAVGTDMAYAVVTKAYGALRLARAGAVEWPTVRRLALGSLPATAATLAFVIWLRSEHLALLERLLLHALGAVLLVTASALTLKTLYASATKPRSSGLGTPAALDVELHGGRLVVLGAALAVVIALTSVGSGSLLFVALSFGTRWQARRIVGTELAHAVLVTGINAIAHIALGTVDWPLVAALLCGSLPGVWLGTALGGRLPDRWLRLTVAVILVMTGWKML